MTDPFTYPRSWGEYKGKKIIQRSDGFHADGVFISCLWPNTAAERIESLNGVIEWLTMTSQ